MPHEAKSSHFLIPILEAAGGEAMVEALLELQQEAVADAKATHCMVSSGKELSDEQADDLCRGYCDQFEVAYGSTPHEMLMAGMDTRDTYLRERIVKLIKEKLRSIARGKFTLLDSASLMAVADPSGSLEQDQVCVLINGVPRIEERVLIYKAPGCHPGDARCAVAVAPPPALRRHLGLHDTTGQSGLSKAATFKSMRKRHL
jgi:hypothetical protein